MDSKEEMDEKQCQEMESQWWKDPDHLVIREMIGGFQSLWGGMWKLTGAGASVETASSASPSILPEMVVAVETSADVCDSKENLPSLDEQPHLERSVGYYQPEVGGSADQDC